MLAFATGLELGKQCFIIWAWWAPGELGSLVPMKGNSRELRTGGYRLCGPVTHLRLWPWRGCLRCAGVLRTWWRSGSFREPWACRRPCSPLDSPDSPSSPWTVRRWSQTELQSRHYTCSQGTLTPRLKENRHVQHLLESTRFFDEGFEIKKF